MGGKNLSGIKINVFTMFGFSFKSWLKICDKGTNEKKPLVFLHIKALFLLFAAVLFASVLKLV